jgi:hypothetical protein
MTRFDKFMDNIKEQGFEAIGITDRDELLYRRKVQPPLPVQRQPLTDEQDRAICEGNCNAESDAFFKARPQFDNAANRRIFYAGHRRAWLSYPCLVQPVQEPERPWVGLTDEEVIEISHLALTRVQAVQMTEAILKEKNT